MYILLNSKAEICKIRINFINGYFLEVCLCIFKITYSKRPKNEKLKRDCEHFVILSVSVSVSYIYFLSFSAKISKATSNYQVNGN